jgi:hypothetical protein
MSKPKKNKPIKPLEGYTAMSDDDVAVVGTAVVTGLTGNSQFPTLPVDLATLKANIESFRALIVEALDGSRKVIAQKDKQREAVIKMLRLLARYVEVTSEVKRHLVCKVGTTSRSSESSNGTPSFGRHKRGIDTSRSRLQSPPSHECDV